VVILVISSEGRGVFFCLMESDGMGEWMQGAEVRFVALEEK